MLSMTSQLSPHMRPGSAGVSDRRSLVECRKEGFDKLYLVFFVSLFLSDDKLSRVGKQLKDWQGWPWGNFPLGRMF